MSYTCVTLAQQPELEAAMPRLHSESWPAFALNGPTAIQYWGSLFSTFARLIRTFADQGRNRKRGKVVETGENSFLMRA